MALPKARRPDDERDQTRIPKAMEEAEAPEIRQRREVHFGKSSADENEDPPAISDAVGLCLSGGGIRSASFSLGLLQAFLEKGFIRWVDYLSTVSGGGFMGAYLSTLLCHGKTTMLDENLDLVPKPGDQAPEPVERFIRGGAYLRDPPMFVDRFLKGFLLNFAIWGGLFIFLASLLALAWRMTHCPPLVRWMGDTWEPALKRVHQFDTSFPVFPAVRIPLVADIAIHPAAQAIRRRQRLANVGPLVPQGGDFLSCRRTGSAAGNQ